MSSSSVRLRFVESWVLNDVALGLGEARKYFDARPFMRERFISDLVIGYQLSTIVFTFNDFNSFTQYSRSCFCLASSVERVVIFDCWSSMIFFNSLMQLWFLSSSLGMIVLHPKLHTIGFFGLYSHSCKWWLRFSSRTTAVQPRKYELPLKKQS